ncbi:type III-A CRISPR-associated RAMP protein Csm3 [Desulfobulbus alkaliphilus]|uniref:type III-A CRISPR-associated RAMP protein Csm3 n=1 Tax=Desulfobulbus alkaliphilus TaxID=869814 RepID=UPI00196606FA|nr:type III-A CRISPR-associated RAMP protein Csm3 [Desulfobulbus alkaliphilus]MBM9536300.1 type III-A CRISPR-associated RAMP protein Csm3 [Desulfobulbus alkaliphilus]
MAQLNNIIRIAATLELVTGLRIGAGDSEMHIGGVDNTVIKHPLTGAPYIPGSSLKGKMRSLLEWRSGAVKEKPLGAKEYTSETDTSRQTEIKHILQLFGIGGGDVQDNKELVAKLGPTRLSFWDCPLEKTWEQEVRDNNQLLTEVKSENVINRISGVAQHPRNTERVPAGAKFDFRLSLKEIDGDDPSLLKIVLQGLKLIELDSLGGSGSRGYGKVQFLDLTINGKDESEQFAKVQAFPNLQKT